MSLSVITFLPLLSAIFVFGLGFFVLSKNIKSKVNVIFNFLSLSVTIWLFGTFMMFISKTDVNAIFWDRFIYIGVVFIPALMYHFVTVFIRDKSIKSKVFKWLGYVLASVFLVASRTDYFVAGLFKYRWGVHAEARILHHIFLVYFSVFMFLVLLNLFNFYRKSKSGLERNHSRYMFLSFFILIFIGFFAYLPAYKISVPPFPFLSGLFFVITLAYAILKYRLLDIRVVIKRSAVFTVLVVVITAVYAFVVTLISYLFQDLLGAKSLIFPGVAMAILVAFGFQPLKNYLQKTTDKFLFKGEYKPQELLVNLTRAIGSTLDLQKLVNAVIKIIVDAFRIEKMSMILDLGEPTKSKFCIMERKGFKLLVGECLTSDNALLIYYKIKQQPIILDELKRRVGMGKQLDGKWLKLMQGIVVIMEKMSVAVVAPIYSKKTLSGFLLLSAKKSGDMFTANDLRILDIVAGQSGVAIENARLYGRVKDFNVALEQEVNKATKSLRTANAQLKVLDKAKSEFISIASHQLRTPLTVVKGYVSMILEGDFGKISPVIEESLDKVYISNERLIKLVEDLLNISRIESGKIEYNFKQTDLLEIIKTTIEGLKPQAEKKNIYLKLDLPDKLLKIRADGGKLRQVISNLLDNSIKYTKKGGITVRIKKQLNNILVIIEDTGVGIDSKDMPNLFQKFSRGKGMSLIHTEGTGLGLFVARKFIEAHHGRIWAKSEGVGQGSRFCFTIPIK